MINFALRKVMAMGGGPSQNVGPDDSLVRPLHFGNVPHPRALPYTKYASLAQENGFALAYVLCLPRLIKAQQSCAPVREECNKYDLTTAPCF